MADWIDAGRVKIIPRGEYSNTVQYEVDDIVTYHHYAYICIKDCIGIHPIDDETSEYWEQFGSAPKVATLTSTGIVKPDGTTISIDEDGTIHGAGGTAESISFDNSGTGLEATNVQDALEEEYESITPYIKCTQAQYDALKSAGTLAKNTQYIITDKPYSADDVLDLATIKSRGASGTLKASDVANADSVFALSQIIKTSKPSATYSVSANGYTSFELTTTSSGYTLVGVLGYSTHNADVAIVTCTISNGKISVVLRNVSSSAYNNQTFDAIALFVKNDFV